jgi:hypothetical protein
MSDIVDRLRKRMVRRELGDDPLVKVFGEAADEIEKLRAKEKDWAEVFDAQKSVIGRLTDTLREIKRCNAQYNFGSKLVRLVDAALGEAKDE